MSLTAVTGKFADSEGNPVVNATAWFQAVALTTGQPTAFTAGDGSVIPVGSVPASLGTGASAGAFTVSLQDGSQALPPIGYVLTLVDNTTQQCLQLPGYGVLPVAGANWSLGSFDPTPAVAPSSGASAGSGASNVTQVKFANTFTAAGSVTFAHNCGDMTPVFQAYCDTAYTFTAVDGNHMTFTVPAAGNLAVTFLLLGASAAGAGTAVAARTPTFSLAAGTYYAAKTVTMTSATPGAAIYYTTDGSTPTTASTLYAGPVALSGSETLSAIATATGFNPSAVTSAAYVVKLPTVAYPMNEQSGGSFAEPIHGVNMAATGVTWAPATGFTGNVAHFDGSTSIAVAANDTYTEFHYNQPFSFVMWASVANATVSAGKVLFAAQGGSPSYSGYSFFQASTGQAWGGQIISDNNNGTEIVFNTPNGSLADTAKHMVVLTYDGTGTQAGTKVYIDVAAQTLTFPGPAGLNSDIISGQPLRLGGDGHNGPSFAGVIKNVRVFNFALTPTDVTNLYALGENA